MVFWKEHRPLRVILMAVFFVLGLILVIAGWKMTGQLAGLGIMLVGLCLLLTALFLYNAIYADGKNKS